MKVKATEIKQFGEDGTRILIRHLSEGIQSGTIRSSYIDNLSIVHDTKAGKNLITVSIDDELIFSYDSNFEEKFKIENHIQKSI